MDKHTMLGMIVERIIGLPADIRRVLYDLTDKCTGKFAEKWLREMKKFQRGEICWAPKGYPYLKPAEMTLAIDPTDGTEIFKNAKNIFTCFSGLKMCQENPVQPTPALLIDIYWLDEDAMSEQIFSSINENMQKLCLTEPQVIGFIKKFPKWVQQVNEHRGREIFFLLKPGHELYIAKLLCFDGKLGLQMTILPMGADENWFKHTCGNACVVVPKIED